MATHSKWAELHTVRDDLACLYRGSFLGCLGPVISLAQFSPDSGFFLMGMHLSAKVDSGARFPRGLAGHLLGWCLLPHCPPRLKTSSAHASGWEIPLTTRTRKLWSLCLSPHQGPVLLLVLCPKASAGEQLQLLSPWPICLLALTDPLCPVDSQREERVLSFIVT